MEGRHNRTSTLRKIRDTLPVGESRLSFAETGKGLNLPVPARIDLVSVNGEPALEWLEQPYTEVAAEGCLKAFVGLANASDDAILRFAQRWGILGIYPRMRRKTNVVGAYGIEWYFTEPLSYWRILSRRALAVLNIASDTFAEKLSNVKWWKDIYDFTTYTANGLIGAELRKIRSLEEQKFFLAAAVSDWLQSVNAYPQLIWGCPGATGALPNVILDVHSIPSLWPSPWDSRHQDVKQQAWLTEHELLCVASYKYDDFRPSPLFNVIALQLAGSVTRPNGIYRCGLCGNIFNQSLEERRMRTDRKNYCSDDCRREAHNAVVRRSDKKKRHES